MKKQLQKVFVACALGAFIGSLVALQLNHYFWWVGLFVGGLVGYFTYEFKEVLRAIPEAWRTVTSWRPDFEYWKALGKASIYSTIFFSVITVPFAMLFLLISEIGVAVAYLLLTPLAGLLMARSVLCGCGREKYQSKVQEQRKLARHNALFVYFWYLPKLTLKGVWWTVLHIPAGIVLLSCFIWQVVKLIHSDERLLCGVDAAIGALVGYLVGNALIGALFGGVFGVANFELVSKLLLKVVPERSS